MSFDAKKLLERLSNTPVLFRDSYSGVKFTAKPIDIFRAEVTLNRLLVVDWEVTAFNYFEELGIAGLIDDPDYYSEYAWDCACLDDQWVSSLEFGYQYVSDADPSKSYFDILLNAYPCDAYPECRGGRS